jgi:hypothetical protein
MSSTQNILSGLCKHLIVLLGYGPLNITVPELTRFIIINMIGTELPLKNNYATVLIQKELNYRNNNYAGLLIRQLRFEANVNHSRSTDPDSKKSLIISVLFDLVFMQRISPRAATCNAQIKTQECRKNISGLNEEQNLITTHNCLLPTT